MVAQTINPLNGREAEAGQIQVEKIETHIIGSLPHCHRMVGKQGRYGDALFGNEIIDTIGPFQADEPLPVALSEGHHDAASL